MQILFGPLTVSRNSQLGGSTTPPLLERHPATADSTPRGIDVRGDSRMEQDGLMESMEVDESGIPTVFFLNVDNLNSNGNQVEEIIGLEDNVQVVQADDDEPFTHHYSVQDDGTIQYHQQNGGHSSGHYDIIEDGGEEHNFEFEEITTMPLSLSTTSGRDLNHIQLQLQRPTELRLQPAQRNVINVTATTITTATPITITTTSTGVFNGSTFRLQRGAPTSRVSFTTTANLISTTNVTPSSGSVVDPNQHQLQPNMPIVNNKRKAPSGNSQLTTTTSSSSSSITAMDELFIEKRPKLVLNLYEEDVGYEFGCILKDNKTLSQMSHLIPYKEDYILKAVEMEEIPVKAIRHLSPHLTWRRGHLLAEIRDYRRFASNGKFTALNSLSNNIRRSRPVNGNNNQLGLGNNKNVRIRNSEQLSPSNLPTPTVKEVILRPSSNSVLYDFDKLISKSINAREKWKVKCGIKSASPSVGGVPKTKSVLTNTSTNGMISSDEEDEDYDEENDVSDYEVEVDIASSVAESCGTLSYDERLELEKEFVNKTAEPLCLDPNPLVSRIHNKLQYERFKWQCPDLNSHRLTKVVPERDEDVLLEGESTLNDALDAFSKFVQTVKEKERLSGGSGIVFKDLGPLGAHPFLEYPILDPPSNIDDILKFAPRPEPCSVRPVATDNYVKKIEEYILETERRKRPHTTKLSIHQRNGLDCYFGELEMESVQEGHLNKPSLHKEHINTTKCQFDLGSLQSVTLYVKQFTDIFTEDGRRPCKITYQKVGQPEPQIIFTSSYKPQTLTPSPSTTPVTTSPGTGVSVQTVGNSPTTMSIPITPVQTQPPVQIVHPQPRKAQTDPNQNPSSAQVNPTLSFPNSTSTNPQLQTQQLLTRPQIVNVNIQQQQHEQQHSQTAKSTAATMNINTSPATAISASHQHLLQQRLLRLKQQQQAQQQHQAVQQQQKPQTALAKLLLTNITPTSTSSSTRPITVAVQPQPQKSSSEIQQLLQHQTQPSTVTPPPSVNLNVNGSSNVSVNLNTMVLDGLLQGGNTSLISQSVMNNANANVRGAQHSQMSIAGQNQTLNLLRVNQQQQSGSVITGSQMALGQSQGMSGSIVQNSGQQTILTTGITNPVTGIQRQYPTSSASLTSLLQQAPHTIQHQTSNPRILINANNGQQITATLTSGNSSSSDMVNSIEELSVPDLTSLLASSAAGGNVVHTNLQTHNIISPHQTVTQHQVDTHNLNLNLNVNLNSGSVITTGDSSGHTQGHGQGPPPFLVFISPLRSVPVSINTNQSSATIVSRQQTATTGSLLQQHLNANTQQPGSLSLNLQPVSSLSDNGGLVNSNSNQIISLHQGDNDCGTAGNGEMYSTIPEDRIKIEPGSISTVDTSTPTSTVMIGNTTYTLSASSQNSISLHAPKKDPNIITLSDLLGSSTSASSNNSNLSSLILSQASEVVLPSQNTVTGSLMSSTPRLSALLAGTPSADHSSMVSLHGADGMGIGARGIQGGNDASRSLLDRLAASLTSPTSGTPNSTLTSPGGGRPGGSGLNPIATATPNVVLDHPVLAATLTGQQPSPKVISPYRQIAPAPTSSPGRSQPQ